MRHDIRKLFEEEDENNVRELPANHREQFQLKLRENKPKAKHKFIFKVAISALLIIGTSIGIYNSQTKIIQNDPLVSQMNTIEKQYLKSIEKEWRQFTSATNDSTLIRRFEVKLEDLNQDHNNLSKLLKSNPENTVIIKSLIDNLQTRLKLLEDIQAHIKILNSKPNAYETVL